MFIDQPYLSIVICTYNGEKTIRKCLDSLVNQSIESKIIEIIVIDNASVDATSKIVSEFISKYDNIKYYYECRVGLSIARNSGFRYSKGSLIAYIDDDAYATNNWCEKIISNFQNYLPQALGGNVYPYYESEKPFWFDDNLESVILGKNPKFLTGIRQRTGFCGSNMCFTRDILGKYYGFNESLGMKGDVVDLGEDLELFFRMSKNNEKLFFDPSMVVYHYVPSVKFKVVYRIQRAKKNGISISKLHKFSNNSPILYSSIRFFYYLFFIPIAFIKNPKISSISFYFEKIITHFYSLRFTIMDF